MAVRIFPREATDRFALNREEVAYYSDPVTQTLYHFAVRPGRRSIHAFHEWSLISTGPRYPFLPMIPMGSSKCALSTADQSTVRAVSLT